jgi:hypothetical protein
MTKNDKKGVDAFLVAAGLEKRLLFETEHYDSNLPVANHDIHHCTS